MKYVIFRKITLNFNNDTRKKCFKENFSTLTLEAEVTFKDPSFDENNFIMDHNEIAEVLKSITFSDEILSCEKVAQLAVQTLLLRTYVVHVKVKVYPTGKNTIAHVTAYSRDYSIR